MIKDDIDSILNLYKKNDSETHLPDSFIIPAEDMKKILEFEGWTKEEIEVFLEQNAVEL